MYYFLSWGETLSRAEPPAGPLKFELSFGDVTFPKISGIFGCHTRTYFSRGIFLKRIDKHNECIPGESVA